MQTGRYFSHVPIWSFALELLLTCLPLIGRFSWVLDEGFPRCREEEAGQSEGKEEFSMGQAMTCGQQQPRSPLHLAAHLAYRSLGRCSSSSTQRDSQSFAFINNPSSWASDGM